MWVLMLSEDEIDSEYVAMLEAGYLSGRGLGQIVDLGMQRLGIGKVPLSVSTKYLNMIFHELKSSLQLHQLFLNLTTSCDKIKWPDLSQLQVLEIATERLFNRRLGIYRNYH